MKDVNYKIPFQPYPTNGFTDKKLEYMARQAWALEYIAAALTDINLKMAEPAKEGKMTYKS